MSEEYRLLLFNGNEWEKIDSYETSDKGRKDAKNGVVGNAYNLCNRINGNIHMRPLDKKCAEDCSKAINDKLNDIRDKIIENYPSLKHANIITESKNAKKPECYNEATHIFDYLSYKTDKNKYQITGVLFYKLQEKDKEYINEKLCEIQFIKIPLVIKALDMYPDTDEGGKYKKVSLGENVYYNSKCDFNSASDEIAKEFMEFVDYWENFD